MIYICENNHVFDEEDAHRVKQYTGVRSEGFSESYTELRCPICGSNDLDEAHECPICGEYSRDTFCENCKEQMAKDLLSLKYQFSENVKANTQLLSETIDRLTDEGEFI